MNIEAIVSIISVGFASILGTLGVFIKMFFKAKADYVKTINITNEDIKKNLEKISNENKEQQYKINKIIEILDIYIANNGVSDDTKTTIKKVVNEIKE